MKSSAKFLKVQSALPRSGSLPSLVYVFFVKSADVRGAVTRDEPLRTSAWEATNMPNVKFAEAVRLIL